MPSTLRSVRRKGTETHVTPEGVYKRIVVPRLAVRVTGVRATVSTPEASLERLVPLLDYLAAWKLLPNVSQWVLQTVEKG